MNTYFRKSWILLATVLLAFTFKVYASDTALITNIPNRETQSLDGKWHYIIDPYQNGFYDYRRIPHDFSTDPGGNAYFTHAKPASKSDRLEYDFDLSPTMLVPGSWGTQVPELTWYEGTVWYQRDFNLQKIKGKRYFLYFGAANYEAHVWVNGKKLGVHVGGFTPFNFDATEVLKDGSNFVVVMVDNTRHASAVPTVATDWWNHGGITRSVQVIELPETFVQDYQIQLSKDGQEIVGQVQLDKAVSGQDVLTLDFDGAEANTILHNIVTRLDFHIVELRVIQIPSL